MGTTLAPMAILRAPRGSVWASVRWLCACAVHVVYKPPGWYGALLCCGLAWLGVSPFSGVWSASPSLAAAAGSALPGVRVFVPEPSTLLDALRIQLHGLARTLRMVDAPEATQALRDACQIGDLLVVQVQSVAEGEQVLAEACGGGHVLNWHVPAGDRAARERSVALKVTLFLEEVQDAQRSAPPPQSRRPVQQPMPRRVQRRPELWLGVALGVEPGTLGAAPLTPGAEFGLGACVYSALGLCWGAAVSLWAILPQYSRLSGDQLRSMAFAPGGELSVRWTAMPLWAALYTGAAAYSFHVKGETAAGARGEAVAWIPTLRAGASLGLRVTRGFSANIDVSLRCFLARHKFAVNEQVLGETGRCGPSMRVGGLWAFAL